jgi:hypothetical protein
MEDLISRREPVLYSVTRLLFRALAGRPLAQVIVGIVLIPAGGLISFAAMSGDYIYPYWIIAGIVFAIVGVIFIIRGATILLKPGPSVQQAMMQQAPYTGPGQYAQQPPYSQYAQPIPYTGPGQYAQSSPYGQQPQQGYERIQYPQE